MNLIEIVILCFIPVLGALGAFLGFSVFGALGFGPGLLGGAALPVLLVFLLGTPHRGRPREARAGCNRARTAHFVVVRDVEGERMHHRGARHARHEGHARRMRFQHAPPQGRGALGALGPHMMRPQRCAPSPG